MDESASSRRGAYYNDGAWLNHVESYIVLVCLFQRIKNIAILRQREDRIKYSACILTLLRLRIISKESTKAAWKDI